MRARQKVSRAGVELIKSFEGLRSTAARLPDGRWTLGYGHTFSAREGARVTQEDADALLRFDLLPIVDALNNLVLVPLNQNQFDALVSFCFNIGVENFAQSTVLKRINEGRMTEAALAMDAWRSAEFNGQTYVLAPLIRRRAAEKNLFLTPEEASGHAPTLLVRPVEDAGGASVQPSELNSPDRGGILSAYPVGTQAPQPDALRPVPEASTSPALSPEMLSPYARPAPATYEQPTPMPQPMAQPVAQPLAQPVERVVESLPDGLMPSGTVRETPVVEAAPVAPSSAPEDREPQMSPEVQAALARAQEEQRLYDEALRQSQAMAAARAAEEARLAEQHRQDLLRLEQERAAAEAFRVEQERREREHALAAAEAARFEHDRVERERAAAEAARLEQARLEQARLEQARLEQSRLEQARMELERAERERAAAAAEAARLEQARLEQERLEQARLEQERLERERLAEAARLEQARLEQARLEQARLEQDRLEQERLERETRERLAREQAASEQEAAKAAAEPVRQPTDDEAEKIRKAEAAAALMRLYSPYGGGSLGKPLGGSLGAPAARPQSPAATPPAAPPPAAPQEFVNQNVITPQPAPAPAVSSAPVETVKPAELDAEDESDVQGFTPFKPVVSPSMMPPPVITALNPYAKPLPKAEPEVVEVPRPRPVDLSATPAAEVFARPEPVRPDLAKAESASVTPLRVEPGTNWREQLQRPLPAGYNAPEAPAPEQQASLLQAAPASRYDQAYEDDSEAWTLDGDRIALSSEEMHEEGASWGKMIASTLWWIFISVVGLACLGVATASWWKANQDPTVVRMGMQGDFTTLSIIAAALGIFFVSVSVWLIMKRLGGLKD